MGNASVMESGQESSLALRPLQLVKTFLASALFFVPLFGLLAMGVLVLAAWTFPPAWKTQGPWSAVAGWSLTGLYAVAGLVAGALVGAIIAAARTFSAFERGIRDQLQTWQPPPGSSPLPALSLSQIRARYEHVVDQMYAGTLGRVRLPGVLERFVRSRFRQALVEDFFADCERRGVSTVGLPELRQWLATRGLDLVTTPVQGQLRVWRVMLLGGLSLLAFLPWALGLIVR